MRNGRLVDQRDTMFEPERELLCAIIEQAVHDAKQMVKKGLILPDVSVAHWQGDSSRPNGGFTRPIVLELVHWFKHHLDYVCDLINSPLVNACQIRRAAGLGALNKKKL